MKALSTLGIAKRANKISYGETLLKDIAKKKVFIVVIASDTGANSLKSIKNKCKYYGVKYVIMFTKVEIAKQISTSVVSAVGIKDENLAHKFQLNMKEGDFIEE